MFCLVLRLFRLAVQELHTWEVYQGTNRGVISDLKPFVDFFLYFFCFVIYVSFYLGTLSSVFKDCFFELIVAHSFLFRFMYSLTCTFFWSMHLCLHLFMETRIYSFMFLICLLLYSFIFWTNSLIVLGNDLFFSLMFRLCSLCIHCFMQHTICCIHLVFFT